MLNLWIFAPLRSQILLIKQIAFMHETKSGQVLKSFFQVSLNLKPLTNIQQSYPGARKNWVKPLLSFTIWGNKADRWPVWCTTYFTHWVTLNRNKLLNKTERQINVMIWFYNKLFVSLKTNKQTRKKRGLFFKRESYLAAVLRENSFLLSFPRTHHNKISDSYTLLSWE